MLFQFNCPGCQSLLEADLAKDALEVVCPICDRTFSASESISQEEFDALPEHVAEEVAQEPAGEPGQVQEEEGKTVKAEEQPVRGLLDLVEEPSQRQPSADATDVIEGVVGPEEVEVGSPPEATEEPLVTASGLPQGVDEEVEGVLTDDPRPVREPVDLEPPPEPIERDEESIEAPVSEQPASEEQVDTEAMAESVPAKEGPDVEMSGEEVFGNYALISQVGVSDVAVTYRARHLPTGIVVALKVLLGNTPWAADEAARILEHLQSLPLSGLEHPNLAKVFELGEVDGVPFIATEYVEGKPFASYLEMGISESEVLSIVEAVADGLSFAHRAGIVHGDIKPSNILIDSYGNPMLVDFGFFRSPETVKKAGISDAVTAERSGYEFPYYVAPELVEGSGAFIESDIYSLGAVIYHFLTKRPPLTSDNLVRLCLKIRDEAPPPPRHLNPDVSSALQSVILKCLAKRPQDRYHDCEEIRSEIHRLMVGQPVSAESAFPLGRAGAVLVRVAALLAIAVAGVGAYWYLGRLANAYMGPQALPPSSIVKAHEAARGGDLSGAESILAQALPSLETLSEEERRRFLPGVYYFLARMKEEAQAHEEAAAYYTKMLRILPDDPAALEGLGRACYFLEKYEEAEQYFNRLVAVKPDHDSRVYRGLALWGMGRLDDADQMLRLAGDSPQVRNYLKQLTLARKTAAGSR